jgi:Na+/proline symporter
MPYFTIDYLIVYAFLAITLIIGFRAGRGIKNIREYAIANKMYGTITLTLTFLATNIGGASILDGTSDLFANGFISVIPELGVTFTLLFIAFFIAKKIVHFDNCLTVGDVMANLYGKPSKFITGILGLFYSIAMVSMELLGLGIAFQLLVGLNPTIGIILGSLVLTIYAGHGGIKSVAITDVFQFLILIIVFPIIASIALKYAGGLKNLFASLPPKTFVVFNHEQFSYYLTLFLVWSVFPVGITSPPIFQRLLMAKEPKQIRNQYLIVAAFHPAFQLLVMFLGFAALVLYPNIDPNHVFPHIVQELLPIGFKGLAIAGLLAVIMSTADSYLHAAGLVLAHDIIKPICDKTNTKINELKIAQYGTLFIGIAATIIALKSTSMLSLSFAAVRFTGPLLMFPLIFGICGLKTDQQTFYIASGITLLTFIIATYCLPIPHKHLGVVISIIVNGLTLVIVHIIKNRGFIFIDRSHGKQIIWQPPSKGLLANLKHLLPTPQHILQYSKDKIAHYGAPYVLFGFFFVINYTLPFFMWSHENPHIYNLLTILRLIGGLLCGLLIVQDKWPAKLRPYMPTYWHITVLYCLPFMNALMFLLTQGSTEWALNIAISIILLLIVVDWVTALILSICGILLGLACYKWLVGSMPTSGFYLDFTAHYLIIYQVIFGTLIGLIFARRRQIALYKVANQRDYIRYLQKSNNRKLAEVLQYRAEFLKDLAANEVEIFNDATVAYLKQAIYRMTDYLRLEVGSCKIDELLKEVLTTIKLQHFEQEPTILPKKYTQHETIDADIAKIKQMLTNACNYIQAYNIENKPITIAWEDALLGHKISHMQGYTRKLDAFKLTVTSEPYVPPTQAIYNIDPTTASTWVPKNESELPLLENACIVDAHYGHASLEHTHTQVYVIPVHLREVRGKVMELLRKPATANPDELKHPLAIQLEKELMDRLEGTQIDLKVIQKALAIIKKYHGGVKRKSGEPFFTHPIAVTLILLDYSQDQAAILTALLHDTVEDTALSIAHIRAIFGDTVYFLVSKVTNLEGHIRRLRLEEHENLHRLMHYEDERVALVKLADRLHNMRTIHAHPSKAKQKNLAHETLAFFVPMAHHLQVASIATELETISLEVLGQ